MTTEGFIGSLPAAVLDQLTTAMGVENKQGVAEDARLGAPPRVTWVPAPRASRKYSGTAQQRPDLHLKAVHDVAPLYLVHLWGGSYTACEQLEQLLEQALYTVFSPNAYAFEDGEQEQSAKPGAVDFLFTIPVRLLRSPLPVVTYQTVTLATSTATSTISDPLGNTPTPGPAGAPEVTSP